MPVKHDNKKPFFASLYDFRLFLVNRIYLIKAILIKRVTKFSDSVRFNKHNIYRHSASISVLYILKLPVFTFLCITFLVELEGTKLNLEATDSLEGRHDNSSVAQAVIKSSISSLSNKLLN